MIKILELAITNYCSSFWSKILLHRGNQEVMDREFFMKRLNNSFITTKGYDYSYSHH